MEQDALNHMLSPERFDVMDTRILDIFDRSGDANLGQTLLRLAKLASSSHRMETAQQHFGEAVLRCAMQKQTQFDTGNEMSTGGDLEFRKDSNIRKDSARIEGLDPQAARSVNHCATGVSPVGTEAACSSQPNSGSISDHTEVN